MYSRTLRPTPGTLRWQQMVPTMVGLNLVAYLANLLSGYWDAAEHAKGAVDRFWYPPHFGIYFALLVAALVSGWSLTLVLQSPGPVRQKLRRNAALVALALANIMNFTGAPFDAWWHETFGLDESAWSPPHIHLIAGALLAQVCCSVYYLDILPVDARLHPPSR